MKSKKLEKEKKPPSEPTVDPTDKVSTYTIGQLQKYMQTIGTRLKIINFKRK